MFPDFLKRVSVKFLNLSRAKGLGLPQSLGHEIWILALGRLLSQLGTGFTLFFAPIFFSKAVGLSATVIGLGLGLGSLAGIGGRLASGWLVDSPGWGRRWTLLVSALVSAIADGVLAATQGLPLFLLGNALMGLGIGLYWPATEAVVSDQTQAEQRGEAFALTRLADNLGLSVGVLLGGLFLSVQINYRWLFLVDGLSYIIFFGIVYVGIRETSHKDLLAQGTLRKAPGWQDWWQGLSDRRLRLFWLINCLFTTYLAQLQSTLPLYLTEFVQTQAVQPQTPPAETLYLGSTALSTTTMSGLYGVYVVLSALLQLPGARLIRRWGHLGALRRSAVAWALGFGAWAIAGQGTAVAVWAAIGLSLAAIATVLYLPAGSAYVAALAPPERRGVYLSLNSQAWAIGYLIGPSLGGWALDYWGIGQAHWLWILALGSTGLAIAGLGQLQPPREDPQTTEMAGHKAQP